MKLTLLSLLKKKKKPPMEIHNKHRWVLAFFLILPLTNPALHFPCFVFIHSCRNWEVGKYFSAES